MVEGVACLLVKCMQSVLGFNELSWGVFFVRDDRLFNLLKLSLLSAEAVTNPCEHHSHQPPRELPIESSPLDFLFPSSNGATNQRCQVPRHHPKICRVVSTGCLLSVWFFCSERFSIFADSHMSQQRLCSLSCALHSGVNTNNQRNP
jgi:hypothetical protein